MENIKNDNISSFDHNFTTNSIQMLKLVMPFFEPSMQQYLCIYIKYMEFQYALSLFKKKPFSPFSANRDMHTLFSDLKPYCSSKDKEKFSQFEQLFASIDNMSEMMEMMSMMKEMFPEGGGMNMNNIAEMFGGDAAGMFNMFQGFNDLNSASNNGSGNGSGKESNYE